MTEPLLVLINGMPCTGKTSLARVLAQRLELPCAGKDQIKEILYEHLGYSDRPRSQALGAASYELLYYFIEVQLKAGLSLIAEANFHAEHAGPRLKALKDRYGFERCRLSAARSRACSWRDTNNEPRRASGTRGTWTPT